MRADDVSNGVTNGISMIRKMTVLNLIMLTKLIIRLIAIKINHCANKPVGQNFLNGGTEIRTRTGWNINILMMV